MSSGGGNTTQTTVQELSPEQRALLKPVIPVAENFVKNPPKQYAGSGIVEFNPLQQQAQQMTLNAANNIGSGINSTIQGMGNVGQGFAQTGAGYGSTIGQAQNQSQSIFPTLNPTFNFMGGAANQNAQQVQQQMAQGGAQTQPGLNFLTSGAVLNPNNNPYLQQAVEAASRPAISQFENVILPNIANDAISAGGFGGTRQQIAQGLAAQGLQQQVGDISSQMFSNAYGQGLNAMNQGLNSSIAQSGQNLQALVQSGQLTQQAANQIMQGQLAGFGAQNAANQTAQSGIAGQQQALAGQQGALSQIPGLLDKTLLPAQLTAGVGEQQQAMEQAKLTETIQKYVNEQLIPFAAAQDVAALAFGIPAGSSRTTTTGGGGGMGGMQLAGGAMSMLPLMMGKSDRRLKDQIKPIGKLSDGLTIYSYVFKKAPDHLQIGLMAQEVQEIYPEAVFETDGYLAVKYYQIPSWMEVAECFHS